MMIDDKLLVVLLLIALYQVIKWWWVAWHSLIRSFKIKFNEPLAKDLKLFKEFCVDIVNWPPKRK